MAQCLDGLDIGHALLDGDAVLRDVIVALGITRDIHERNRARSDITNGFYKIIGMITSGF